MTQPPLKNVIVVILYKVLLMHMKF